MAPRPSTPHSRRSFLRVAGLGTLGVSMGSSALAAELERTAALSAARQIISAKETQLASIWGEFAAAGFPLKTSATPPPFDWNERRARTLNILVDLRSDLAKQNAEELMRTLVRPVWQPTERRMRPTTMSVLVAPNMDTSILPVGTGCIGAEVLYIILDSVFGLDREDVDQIILSSLTHELTQAVKLLVWALIKAEVTEVIKERIGKVVEIVLRVILKLSNGQRMLVKIRNRIGVKALGTFGVMISLGITIYENWTTIRRHL